MVLTKVLLHFKCMIGEDHIQAWQVKPRPLTPMKATTSSKLKRTTYIKEATMCCCWAPCHWCSLILKQPLEWSVEQIAWTNKCLIDWKVKPFQTQPVRCVFLAKQFHILEIRKLAAGRLDENGKLRIYNVQWPMYNVHQWSNALPTRTKMSCCSDKPLVLNVLNRM